MAASLGPAGLLRPSLEVAGSLLNVRTWLRRQGAEATGFVCRTVSIALSWAPFCQRPRRRPLGDSDVDGFSVAL